MVPDDETLDLIEAHMRCGNELLTRIDEHLERGIQDFSSEHLARGAAYEARIEEHLARCAQVISASGEAYDDWRFSMRQDSLRNERILGEISQSMQRLNEESASRTADIVAEGRAQRAALWAILDRMQGGDGPAPATG